MLNAELVAPETPVAAVLRVYPVPALSMDTPENVATPETGETPPPPVNVPLPALVPIAREMAGVMDAPDPALDGCCEKTRCVPVPAVPVALNVTGLPPPENPVAVAVSEFPPAVVPRVHEPMDAMPVAPVVVGLVPVSDPPPVTTAKVTDTP